MSDKNHDFGSLVCIYSQILPRVRAAAKDLGYAVAIHGTMANDLDLVAVPWIEEAAEPQKLVRIIADIVGGFIIGDSVDNRGGIPESPTQQPHGRISWNICWGGRAFIDLSIIPPLAALRDELAKAKRQIGEMHREINARDNTEDENIREARALAGRRDLHSSGEGWRWVRERIAALEAERDAAANTLRLVTDITCAAKSKYSDCGAVFAIEQIEDQIAVAVAARGKGESCEHDTARP